MKFTLKHKLDANRTHSEIVKLTSNDLQASKHRFEIKEVLEKLNLESLPWEISSCTILATVKK